MVAIVLGIIGVVLLCRGRVYLGNGRHAEGTSVRVAGAVLMMGLPISFLIELVGILDRGAGGPVDPNMGLVLVLAAGLRLCVYCRAGTALLQCLHSIPRSD